MIYTSFCYACRQAEFEQKLEKAQKELELLKEQRNQQKHVADSAMRQRDMYRILLQTAGVDLPPQGELTVVVMRYETTDYRADGLKLTWCRKCWKNLGKLKYLLLDLGMICYYYHPL